MSRLFLNIVVGILTLWLADKFIKGVEFNGSFFILPTNEKQLIEFLGSLVFIGSFLGFLNFFIKPILDLITLPLKIITLGLFSLILNLFLVEIVDIIFGELDFKGVFPLFWTTLIFWVLTLFILVLFPKVKKILG